MLKRHTPDSASVTTILIDHLIATNVSWAPGRSSTHPDSDKRRLRQRLALMVGKIAALRPPDSPWTYAASRNGRNGGVSRPPGESGFIGVPEIPGAVAVRVVFDRNVAGNGGHQLQISSGANGAAIAAASSKCGSVSE